MASNYLQPQKDSNMAADNDDTASILAEAEAEVRAEKVKVAKEQLKGQLRKVAAAEAVLRNEQRQLEVIKRSISED
jgi:hypothetical protein